MSEEEQLDAAYESGAWAAFAIVLAYVNTLENKMVSKGEIWDAVFEMRPPKRLTIMDFEEMFKD